MFRRVSLRTAAAPIYAGAKRAGEMAMKHPQKSDFDTTLTEDGVVVTFKPTNSVYSFYRLADSGDVARLGPISPANVRHAGPSGDTGDYPADEVAAMAQMIAAEIAKPVWSVRGEDAIEQTTLCRVSIAGDDETE
jgi:hypothetical protein